MRFIKIDKIIGIFTEWNIRFIESIITLFVWIRSSFLRADEVTAIDHSIIRFQIYIKHIEMYLIKWTTRERCFYWSPHQNKVPRFTSPFKEINKNRSSSIHTIDYLTIATLISMSSKIMFITQSIVQLQPIQLNQLVVASACNQAVFMNEVMRNFTIFCHNASRTYEFVVGGQGLFAYWSIGK